jgi:hypothetical protein
MRQVERIALVGGGVMIRDGGVPGSRITLDVLGGSLVGGGDHEAGYRLLTTDNYECTTRC